MRKGHCHSGAQALDPEHDARPRGCMQLMPEVAAVLAYEVLLGQGCKKSGPAERALMGAKVRSRGDRGSAAAPAAAAQGLGLRALNLI